MQSFVGTLSVDGAGPLDEKNQARAPPPGAVVFTLTYETYRYTKPYGFN